MTTPAATKIADRITKAAQLRVDGESWDAIAKRFRYKTAESARVALTRNHREEWLRAFNEALTDDGGEGAREAMLTQRQLMRPFVPAYDKHGKELVDEKGRRVVQEVPLNIRQAAAHSLLNHYRALQAKAGPLVTVDNSQHEHHTHQYGELEEDELDRLVADRRTRFARIQGEVAGGNGSAGPRSDGAGGGNGRKKDS